ncbi:conserved Plasmodium protein, unknown function [Plasmodium malariae]|uniref:Uncharacterized protein n=1 Tax=Plasmodium malariae TaxID=5858 RepID=A0A1C3KAI1_PLAMA|nr:conserved Plasmodium protein, unknown function [Plasmodium malariae]
MNDSFKIRDLNKFRLSEERIIEKFTRDRNEILLNESPDTHLPVEVERNREPHRSSDECLPLMNTVKTGCDNHGEENDISTSTKDFFVESLLYKIRNLENEKKYLLKFLEKKKKREIEYKKALEAQAAFVNSESKKYKFYEDEWLHMKSLEYFFINSGEEPLRHKLELFYEDTNLYEKLGSLTGVQEMFIETLIEDHRNLIKEKRSISKKYHEAVDANFQLYQQNEMLKAQNISLLEKSKDIINEELQNKLEALNLSLIYVQKENLHLKEVLDQYSRLITNIKICPAANFLEEELDKFKTYLLI